MQVACSEADVPLTKLRFRRFCGELWDSADQLVLSPRLVLHCPADIFGAAALSDRLGRVLPGSV
jgi:hypothetical protein